LASLTPFFTSAQSHYKYAHKSNCRAFPYYSLITFHPEWNTAKDERNAAGVFARNAERWALANDMANKPGPGWQLHVRKTEAYPNGYFGPDGIVWMPPMDVHDRRDLQTHIEALRWYLTNGTENHRDIIHRELLRAFPAFSPPPTIESEAQYVN
jgi:hypothetical protein